MISAPDRAELGPGLRLEAVLLVLAGDSSPGRRLEERAIDRGVIRGAGAANSKADPGLYLVGDSGEILAGVVSECSIGANGGVAARDIETDTNNAHLVAIPSHAADRHDVALVPVSHESGCLGPAGYILELGDRALVVGAENRRLR